MIDFQSNLTPQELRYCENDAKVTYEAYKVMKKYKRKQVIKKILYYFAGFLVAAVFWLMVFAASFLVAAALCWLM